MSLELTAVFRKDPDGGFVAFAEELPGANRQGETLDEARANLREGGSHSIFATASTDKVSTVPRHREIKDFLARKICKDLDVPGPDVSDWRREALSWYPPATTRYAPTVR